MSISRRVVAMAITAVIVAAACAATLFAQAGATGTGSLAELTAEIRQLRAAVEQSSRAQAQAHALGIFLTAQDRRVMMVTGRLETARRELVQLSQQTSTYTHQLAQIEEELPVTTDAEERKALEDRIKDIKLEMKVVAGREQDARTRETEMLQAWQQEDARWNDLIGRLQQIVER
jgi:chromosome segregation ATPase